MANNISPEEKLLGLIRNKGGNKRTDAVDADKTPPKAFSETIQAKADERLTGMLKSDIFKSRLFEPATLKKVNKYLLIILGVLMLYFLIDLAFIRPYRGVQSLLEKSQPGQTAQAAVPASKNGAIVKDYSSYSSAISSRTIFGQAQGQDISTGNAITSDNISERVGLVGILPGDNPQAIIEDKKAQKTYYLNKGQSFDGYAVEEITDNKVTLNYEGKKITLFL